jgi:hypothetical protein
MEAQLNDDRLIARYLLDDLPEAEQIQFEERYLADQAVFEQMRAIEEELIADYLRGGLAGRELARFESRYLNTPEGRERIAFAKALLEAVSEERPAPVTVRDEAGREPWWRAWLSSLRPQTLAAGFALAALLLATTGSWLFFQNRNLRRQLDQTIAERTSGEQRTRELEAARSKEREQLEQEVRRVTSELESARQKIEQLRTTPASPLQSILASFLLLPTSRGTGDTTPELRIPSDEGLVELRLVIDEIRYRRYRIAIQAMPGGKIIWDQGGLAARPRPGLGLIVTASVPASRFTSTGTNEFLLTLSRPTTSGKFEDLDEYRFRVIRQ